MTHSAAGAALEVEQTKTILPDAAGVFDAIARIGYEFEQAIADLVDNSIDADATEVLIRFFYDSRSVYSVAVIDNGHGMDGERADQAMAFGARTGKTDDDLGKYGMGLKSASFSQCRVLTVLSRKDGQTVGRRWTAENVRKDWLCETIVRTPAERHLKVNSDRVNTSCHGTLVQWDELDELSHSVQRPAKTLEARFTQLSNHLGLVFHRFIEQGRIRIRMDSADPDGGHRGPPQQIKPLNPFPRYQGFPGYPRVFRFDYPGTGPLQCETHIWRRNATEAGFRLGGGRLAKRQGFYIYRNDRLIQPGGWNGLRNDAEVHTSLARVRFDVPPALDPVFKPTVQKSSVTLPEGFVIALREGRSEDKTFTDFLSDAERAYRDLPTGHNRDGLIPSSGMTRELTGRFEKILGPAVDDDDKVVFEWASLPDDEFFRVDPDTHTIVLNSAYRSSVLHGLRGSSGDAPVVKTLLMLLVKEDMRRVNRVKKHEVRTKIYNQLLVEAAKSQW